MTYQDVEEARKQYLSRVVRQACVVVALSAIVAIIIGVFSSTAALGSSLMGIMLGFIIMIIGLIIILFLNQKQFKEYHRAYKEYFIEQNLHTVFSQLEYKHELGLPSSFLCGTGMINTGDRYKSNDYTRGKYQDVAFCQADVSIETEYTDSDGDTHYSTIFKGRFMVFEFPKEFNFKLALVGKNFRAFRKPLKNKTTGRKLEKIATESDHFNKIIKTYAEDGFEAFYLLDPKTIAKIEDITTRHNNRIVFLFCNNQLIIGLDNGKDSFEPPLPFKQIDEAKEKAKVGSDIRIITEFVDELALNRKIFKK